MRVVIRQNVDVKVMVEEMVNPHMEHEKWAYQHPLYKKIKKWQKQQKRFIIECSVWDDDDANCLIFTEDPADPGFLGPILHRKFVDIVE